MMIVLALHGSRRGTPEELAQLLKRMGSLKVAERAHRIAERALRHETVKPRKVTYSRKNAKDGARDERKQRYKFRVLFLLARRKPESIREVIGLVSSPIEANDKGTPARAMTLAPT